MKLWNALANRSWLLIVFGFVLLITVWITFFTIAADNQPVRLDITAPQSSDPTAG
jgi:hypothetical protein